MEVFYRALQKILRDDQLTIPSKNYDLVLDIMPGDDKIKWSYYYACHETRCLFWLEPYDGSYMISQIPGLESPALVSASESLMSCTITPSRLIRCAEHRMEDLYWYVNNLLLDWHLDIDAILIGTTGHSFQSFLRIATFRRMSTMNSWGYWHMVAWVSLWISARVARKFLTSMT
jgi:hypothetical protein